jgi:cytochrome c peroxidase
MPHRFGLRVFALGCAAVAQAQIAPPPPSLRTVRVPEPDNILEFVKDRKAAIALGKSLFWDMQVGSDGVVACATCHFNAGADSRVRNVINPALNRVNSDYQSWPDRFFEKPPGATLTAADFPRPLTSNDVVSSTGVFHTLFEQVVPGEAEENVSYRDDPDGFRIGSLNMRRVEARNTPTIINAVFNFRQFWDARAQDEFNGVNHLGSRDPSARVYKVSGNSLAQVSVLLRNSSLASQAVAPPLNGTEMSATGRTFFDIFGKFAGQTKRAGKKLTVLRPLGKQLVHKEDSVLGSLSRWPQRGLKTASYADMIRAAFRAEWHSSAMFIVVDEDGRHRIVRRIGDEDEDDDRDDRVFTQMQYNFGLFFGLAIQMYESTLVADDTPFDRFRQGDASALSDQQKRGMNLFLDTVNVRCINCHGGAELTDASVSRVSVNRIRWREFQLIDTGFNNIGVRPTTDDLGIGADDGSDLNRPLAMARWARNGTFVDPTLPSPPASDPSRIAAVDGAFKVPGLRNVELTAPYFHNGGQLTLRGVIDFYARGGDFAPQGREGTITGLHTFSSMPAEDREALVAFLVALTDERVRFQRAPFDHPQIIVPNGHLGTTNFALPDGNGQAIDWMMEIPAVGRNGGTPIRKFLQ